MTRHGATAAAARRDPNLHAARTPSSRLSPLAGRDRCRRWCAAAARDEPAANRRRCCASLPTGPPESGRRTARRAIRRERARSPHAARGLSRALPAARDSIFFGKASHLSQDVQPHQIGLGQPSIAAGGGATSLRHPSCYQATAAMSPARKISSGADGCSRTRTP